MTSSSELIVYFPNAVEATSNALHEAQVAKITSYEEALAKIKDATGVSDIQEVVDRFLNQGDTKRHLEQLQEENTKTVARLKEEKEKLQEQFEDMKYSGEAKMSTYVIQYQYISIFIVLAVSSVPTMCIIKVLHVCSPSSI